MTDNYPGDPAIMEFERYELREDLPYQFDFSRREFAQVLGAGILISIIAPVRPASALMPAVQGDGRRIGDRLHIGTDGLITIMTGKVEVGQGSRTEIIQAAAEELRVAAEAVRLVMGDTRLVPDDGGTYGSQTTPRTVPAVRRACALARQALMDLASKKLGVEQRNLTVEKGRIGNPSTGAGMDYAGLAREGDFDGPVGDPLPRNGLTGGAEIDLTPVKSWRIMGRPAAKANGRDIVTGAHRYPSDIHRTGMLYGKIMRAPSYGAKLLSIDFGPAESMEGVITVRDGDFVGVAAPASSLAEEALKAILTKAQWNSVSHTNDKDLFAHLRRTASSDGGGEYGKPRIQSAGSMEKGFGEAHQILNATFEVSYIQHTPMEPRAAAAEWDDGRVTVWTGTQAPSRVQSQVAEAFHIPAGDVRVIVPDTGGGFGGKHSGEVAVEAARLAKAAGRPVSVRWTREEEFTHAYFRPAGLIEVRGALDESGRITAWDFINYNSGTSALSTPYDIPNVTTQFRPGDAPLRQGSYRGLAATANVFARESFMDELAAKAKADPLDFRLNHLSNDRLTAVLLAAAEKFDWKSKAQSHNQSRGIGLACGTEKGSYTAACVEIEVDDKTGAIKVLNVCQAFECGAIINPDNLRMQVEGCIIMGLGGALWEEIKFENGKVLNPKFSQYRVPRFKDTPEIDTVLLDRPDIPSAGAGETPIIAIAPAIASAVYALKGIRIRSMPITL